jgi:hypothetical protein
MAFTTVDERRSANNIATFGINSLLFIPLTSDGSFSTNDSENILGYWIGLNVEITESWTAPDISPYKSRFTFRRLGRSRDRVYRITVSDAIKWVISNAYLEAESTPDVVGHDPDGRIFRRLGTSRDRVYRITMSDAVKLVISKAYVEVG